MTEPSLTGTNETFCYVHKNTPTKLACSRCGNPICGRCAIPATVGQHCPDCVAEARRSAPKVKVTSQLASTAPVVMTLIAINIVMFIGEYVIDGFTENLVQFPPFISAR